MSVNFPHMLSVQSEHVAHIVGECFTQGIRKVEASDEAERAGTDTIVGQSAERIAFFESCTPGYYNNEGGNLELAARSMPYGGGPLAFIQILEDWRWEGGFNGLELDRVATAQENT